jgi:hypothetical protein
MIQGIFTFLLLVALTGRVFVQDAAPPKILLIETGNFFPEDVKAKDGEKWLGLYVTKGGSSLIESKVTVKTFFVDRNPAGQKSIGVDRPDKPVFLVKGATMLKPGPATTIYRGGKEEKDVLVDASNPASRKPKQLKLGDQEYQLKVLAPNVRPAKLQLALVSGAQTQILYTPKTAAGTAVWRLLWVGDADGDGKLDLYVQLEREDTLESKLFLSSQAKPGQFVNEVANFVAN